jgi:uracil-DNA glycosylase
MSPPLFIAPAEIPERRGDGTAARAPRSGRRPGRGSLHGITIVGEAPSQSSDPKKPFHGASGARLAQLAGLGGVRDLERAARLVNVLQRWPGFGHAGEKGSKVPIAKAKRAAKKIELVGVVVLAGRRVARAFGLDDAPYFQWFRTDRHGPCNLVVVPHPSGSNRFWNYPENRELARAFFLRLFAAQSVSC